MFDSKLFQFIVTLAALCLVVGLLYLIVVIGHWLYDSLKAWCQYERKEKKKK